MITQGARAATIDPCRATHRGRDTTARVVSGPARVIQALTGNNPQLLRCQTRQALENSTLLRGPGSLLPHALQESRSPDPLVSAASDLSCPTWVRPQWTPGSAASCRKALVTPARHAAQRCVGFWELVRSPERPVSAWFWPTCYSRWGPVVDHQVRDRLGFPLRQTPPIPTPRCRNTLFHPLDHSPH